MGIRRIDDFCKFGYIEKLGLSWFASVGRSPDVLFFRRPRQTNELSVTTRQRNGVDMKPRSWESGVRVGRMQSAGGLRRGWMAMKIGLLPLKFHE